MDAVVEGDALGLHLRDAAVDDVLLHLEVGDAVAQQAAGLGVLLEEVHVVAGARELLRAGHAAGPSRSRRPACRSCAPATSGAIQPFCQALSTIAHSIVLMVTGVSSRFSVQDASQGAGQTRPVNSGKLLVECRLRERLLPVAEIDEVVPVGDLVVHRAAGVAVRNAAIHAARGLVARAVLAERDHELAEVADAIRRRQVLPVARSISRKPVTLPIVRLPSSLGAAAPLAHSVPEHQPLAGRGRTLALSHARTCLAG